MHQANATVWNQIAEQQPLATTWAQEMFPLPADQLMRALEREEKRLAAGGNGAVVAAAYLKVMPLLWEKVAISNFLSDNPDLAAAIPPIETATEAVAMASKDFSLTVLQKKRLLKLLQSAPQ